MLFILLLASLAGLSSADLLIDCRYSDAIGTWYVSESARTWGPDLNCTTGVGEVVFEKQLTLTYPNEVTDEQGKKGTWTLIYNQGFEIKINERSYYANFYNEPATGTYSCDRLSTGWSRDDTARHWACYIGSKSPTGASPPLRHYVVPSSRALDEKFVNDDAFIARLNAAQASWTARAYEQHEQYTVRELIQRAGGFYRPLPPTVPATDELKARVALLPPDFDWRSINNVSYLSPVRDQGNCGSCYTFASAALLESRVRITTNNVRQDIFSTQDIVSCSDVSQGCNGGFAFLVAGRYAKGQGFVNEECNPYTGMDDLCNTDMTCDRTFVTEYQFVGGYYGGANEELMMEALVKHGPIAVDFNVEDDFRSYSGGIYSHVTSVESHFNPFYVTNHVVLMVGYGVEPTTGEKFWIVKNSWGADWGEEGYFRIRRGTNEVSIESAPFDITIIP